MFFFKIQITRLFTFFEMSSKTLKTQKTFFQDYAFLHFEISNGHFYCKTVRPTHMPCYTYNILY